MAQPGNTNRYFTRVRYYLSMADSLQGLPADTFPVRADFRNYNWLAQNNDQLYKWSIPLLKWVPLTSTITNIFNNSITNTTVINQTDSSVTIQICTGDGACDTSTFATTINNISNTFPINDSTIVFCGTDTVTAITTCDTVHIPPQTVYMFQNGTIQIAPGIVEHGGNPLLHNTTLPTGYNLYTISGHPVYNYPLNVVQEQNFANGAGLQSWRSFGGIAGEIDFNNKVKLGITYTGKTYPDNPTNLNGYFNKAIGYMEGVNFTPNGSFGDRTDTSISKIDGILFHTLDTSTTDAITFFGKHPPNVNYVGTPVGPGLESYRIVTMHDNKNLTFHGYDSSRADESPTRILGVDNLGNVKVTQLPQVSVTNIINDSSFTICTVNSCDTFVVHNVSGPITNITIINDSTLQVCGSAVLSAELVTNGDFTGDATGWELGALWSYNSNNLIHSFGSTQATAQSGGLIEGGEYTVSADVGGTVGTVDIKLDAGTTQTYNAGAGTVTFTGNWSNGTNYKIVLLPSNDFDGTIDNVSVKQVLPNCDTLQIIPSVFIPADTFFVKSPIHSTGVGVTNHDTIYIDIANRVDTGALTNQDWTYFNHKVDSIYVHSGAGLDSFFYDNGDEIGILWHLAPINCNELVAGGQVVFSGTPYVYNVEAAFYRINCQFYSSPPTQFTIDSADCTNPRTDVFFVDTSGNAGYLPGIAATPNLKPSIDKAWQFELTSLDIPICGTPLMDTVIIYNNNVGGEWIPVTNTGTTTNPDNLTNVWIGNKSLNVTNINNNDNVIFTQGGTFDLSSYDAVAGFVKLKANLPNAANIRLRWFNGATAIGSPVNIGLNKTNLTTYQAWQIPLTAFALNSNLVTSLHIQYTAANNTNNAGMYFDYIYLQRGIPPTQPSGTIVAYNGLRHVKNNNIDSIRLGDFISPGAPLIATTYIDAGAFSLRVRGSAALLNTFDVVNSGSGTAVSGVSSSGVGGEFDATSGIGVRGVSNSNTGGVFFSLTGLAATYTVDPATTTTVTEVARYARSTQGTAGTGIGGSIDLFDQTVAGGTVQANQIIWKWTDPAFPSRTSEISFTGYNNTVKQALMTLAGSGQLTLNQYTTANFNGGTAADSVLVVTSAGVVKKRNAAAFGGGGGSQTLQQTFDIESATAVMNKDNTISNGANTLFMDGSDEVLRVSTSSGSGGTYALQATSGSSGGAIAATSISGEAIRATSSSGLPGVFDISNPTGNVALAVLQLRNVTSGTPGDGNGVSIEFFGTTTLPTITDIGRLQVELTDATNVRSLLSISGKDGVFTENILFTLSGTGAAALPMYGSGIFTSTPTYNLAVDASGNIIEVATGGGSTLLPLTGSASATGDVTSTLAGHDVDIAVPAGSRFQITNGSTYNLQFDPDGFQTNLKSDDGTAFSELHLNSNSGGAVTLFELNANNGVNNVVITGDADANSIVNTAATITFNGNVGVGGAPLTSPFVASFDVNDGGTNHYITVAPANFLTLVGATDGTASSAASFTANLAGNSVTFTVQADDGTNQVQIYGDAQAQTITYSAAAHTFNGTMVLDDLSGTGTRAVLADATGTLSAPVSDITVKENIQPLGSGINTIMQLRPVSFYFKQGWRNYGEGQQIGFIAQDIEKVLPNSVFVTPKTGKMGYNETDIIPLLVKAVQEQEIEIENLKQRIRSLQNK